MEMGGDVEKRKVRDGDELRILRGCWRKYVEGKELGWWRR